MSVSWRSAAEIAGFHDGGQSKPDRSFTKLSWGWRRAKRSRAEFSFCLRSACTTRTLNDRVIETHFTPIMTKYPIISRELKIYAAHRRLRRLPGSKTNIKWKWKHTIEPINCEITSKALHISSYSLMAKVTPTKTTTRLKVAKLQNGWFETIFGNS